jgi:hypothetical protein
MFTSLSHYNDSAACNARVATDLRPRTTPPGSQVLPRGRDDATDCTPLKRGNQTTLEPPKLAAKMWKAGAPLVGWSPRRFGRCSKAARCKMPDDKSKSGHQRRQSESNSRITGPKNGGRPHGHFSDESQGSPELWQRADINTLRPARYPHSDVAKRHHRRGIPVKAL